MKAVLPSDAARLALQVLFHQHSGEMNFQEFAQAIGYRGASGLSNVIGDERELDLPLAERKIGSAPRLDKIDRACERFALSTLEFFALGVRAAGEPAVALNGTVEVGKRSDSEMSQEDWAGMLSDHWAKHLALTFQSIREEVDLDTARHWAKSAVDHALRDILGGKKPGDRPSTGTEPKND